MDASKENDGGCPELTRRLNAATAKLIIVCDYASEVYQLIFQCHGIDAELEKSETLNCEQQAEDAREKRRTESAEAQYEGPPVESVFVVNKFEMMEDEDRDTDDVQDTAAAVDSSEANIGKLTSDSDNGPSKKLGKYQCTVCSYSINNRTFFGRHMATHGENPFKCTQCDYSSRYETTFKRHMSSHSNERPYECIVCSFRFGCSTTLKRHMATHTGVKPFKCQECSYSTSRADILKTHMTSHTGLKRYTCSICPYSGCQASDLKKHMSAHLGQKPYKCSLCPYSSSWPGTLKTHMAVHTGDKPHKCPHCSYCTAIKQNLNTHIGRKHGDEIQPLQGHTIS